MRNRTYEGYKDVEFVKWCGKMYKVTGFITEDAICLVSLESDICECGKEHVNHTVQIIQSPNFIQGLEATYSPEVNQDSKVTP